ncbi:MAG TPA: VapC toxin family PIN domain ribonuclease [Oceanospirillaceae bacterium]|nr:VapC toxin family PIN domain ribonuclease [Oceanospirillaceae bacterium]
MSKPKYMLDTNTVSYLIKGQPAAIKRRLQQLPISQVCISSITHAELLLGVAKKPDAKWLPKVVHEFLIRVDTLSWGACAAQTYAFLRASCEARGVSLSAMDMLIAAHAKSENLVLVTNDKAFYHLQDQLALEDWS